MERGEGGRGTRREVSSYKEHTELIIEWMLILLHISEVLSSDLHYSDSLS
jgi:hypothetical protein